MEEKKSLGKTLASIAGGVLLCALLLWWTAESATAKGASGYLQLVKPAVLQSEPPDPERFLEGLTLIMPRPVVTLTIDDAVARELLMQSHTLSQIDALRTARVLCDEARAVGYDPLLVLAVIKVESGFDHFAVSPTGAEGLMQILPSTGTWLADKLRIERPDGHSFDPVLNVRLGTRYLAQLRQQFRHIDVVLTAYNRGPGATRVLLETFGEIPNDVREYYAAKVLERYASLRHAYGALPAS